MPTDWLTFLLMWQIYNAVGDLMLPSKALDLCVVYMTPYSDIRTIIVKRATGNYNDKKYLTTQHHHSSFYHFAYFYFSIIISKGGTHTHTHRERERERERWREGGREACVCVQWYFIQSKACLFRHTEYPHKIIVFCLVGPKIDPSKQT